MEEEVTSHLIEKEGRAVRMSISFDMPEDAGSIALTMIKG